MARNYGAFYKRSDQAACQQGTPDLLLSLAHSEDSGHTPDSV